MELDKKGDGRETELAEIGGEENVSSVEKGVFQGARSPSSIRCIVREVLLPSVRGKFFCLKRRHQGSFAHDFHIQPVSSYPSF